MRLHYTPSPAAAPALLVASLCCCGAAAVATAEFAGLSDVALLNLQATAAQEAQLLEGERRLLTAIERRQAALEANATALQQRLATEVAKRRGRGSLRAAVGAAVQHQQRSLTFRPKWAQQLTRHMMVQSLAALTGLKAFIPLLVEVLSAKYLKSFPLQLRTEFEWMTSWWFISIIGVLAFVEIVCDAIPVVDEIADLVMLAIKPAICALIVVSQHISDTTDARAMLLIVALVNTVGVTMSKQAATMMLDVATGGSGAPFRSIGEDVAASGLAFLTFVAPVASPLIIATSFVVSFAFCFSGKGRTSSKAAPHLAALCLWPKPGEVPLGSRPT